MKNSYTNSNERGITRKEFDEIMHEIPKDKREFLWEQFQKSFTSEITSTEWSDECSMCGRPISYRLCGMCPHCEMVWNS